MGKHYTDYERYEHCRKHKISGMNVSEYARVNNLNRNTFKDWVAAYNNINGTFINVSTVKPVSKSCFKNVERIISFWGVSCLIFLIGALCGKNFVVIALIIL